MKCPFPPSPEVESRHADRGRFMLLLWEDHFKLVRGH